MNIQVKYATIIVGDMEASIRFYKDVMGFDIDSEYNPQPDTQIILMKGQGGAMVELIKNTQYDTGFYSVGMDVEDLNATIEALKAKGVTITLGPIPTLVGSLAFTEDPNGVKIALIEHH